MPGMLVGMWKEEEGGAPLTFQSTDIPVHRNVPEGGERRKRERKGRREEKEKMRKNIPCAVYTYAYTLLWETHRVT